MGLADLCFRRSASLLASSVCGGRVGRVRSMSTVVNSPFLVRNPCTFRRPFPFKIEDIPGDRTVTLTREYNGEHIKVVVSMPIYNNDDDEDDGDDDDAPSSESNDGDDDAPSNESKNDEDDVASTGGWETLFSLTIPFHKDYDAPSNESNDEDDDDDDKSPIPLLVTVTKKSGRSLELSCRIVSDKIIIDAIHVNLPGEDPKVLEDMDNSVGMDHEDMKKGFNSR